MTKVELEDWEREHVEKITQLEQDRIGLTNGNRKATIACGKELRKLQKKQKEQQKKAKERGEEAQVWEDYVEEKNGHDGPFPWMIYVGMPAGGGKVKGKDGKEVFVVPSEDLVCQYEFGADGEQELNDFNNGLARWKTPTENYRRMHFEGQKPPADYYVIRRVGAPRDGD